MILSLRVVMIAVLVLWITSPMLRAQSIPVLTLSRPDAVLAHEFTFLVDVHELPDGQLAVLDRGDVSVLIADATLKNTRRVGRIGGGPGEYRVPIRLFGMTSPQFAVLERSEFDLLRYSADGRFLGALKPADIAQCRNNVQSPLGHARFSATDASGRVYLQGSAIARDPRGQFQLADSAPVLRWTPPCAVDTVAYTPVPRSDVGRVVSDAEGRPFVAGVAPDDSPFASESQWAVLPDGRIAVVHLAPYRVDIVDATGRRERGSNIAHAAIPVTNAHKAQWRHEQQRSQPTLTVTRALGASSGMGTKPYEEPDAWPRVLPPFPRDAVRTSPDGRVWVQRNVAASAAPSVDVFDSGARRVQQVVLPAGRRLLGVGRGVVYLLYQDHDDLQYIERYRVPTSR